MLDDLAADMKILRQEVNINFGGNKKAKLRLPITNQQHLEEVEANFALYEEDLRLIFNKFVAHKIYDMFRHFTEQILLNTDYYNWTGTKAFNSPDDRIPKNASVLKIFQLLLGKFHWPFLHISLSCCLILKNLLFSVLFLKEIFFNTAHFSH